MLEMCLGFMAAMSGIINYQDFDARNIDFDGNKLSQSHSNSRLSFNNIFQKLSNTMSLRITGLLWILAYVYHYTIAVLFPEAVVLNILNVIVAVLLNARFLRLFYRLSINGRYRGSILHSDLLTTVSSTWEIILSGVVLLHSFFN